MTLKSTASVSADHDPRLRPTPPWLQLLYLYLVTGLLIAVRPHPAIRALLTALFIYACVQFSADCTSGPGDVLGNYVWGSNFGSTLIALPLFFWLDNPMKWRYRDEAAMPETYPLWKRIYYAISILWSPRLIGWDTQVANVPPLMTKSRAVFLRQAAYTVVKSALVVDLAGTYVKLQPLIELRGTPGFPTGLRGYLMASMCLFAYCTKTYASVRLQHSCLAIVCVATGLGNGDPEMWPDLFGSWSDAYTVRRFWGQTWHQLIRRHFSACGKAVSSTLGFKKGSNASSYSKLYTAFFLSGLLHSFGDLALGEPFGKSMPFFLTNAVAITFEDAAISVARRLGVGSATKTKGKEGPPPRWVRVLGYTWVFVWFSYSLRQLVWWTVPHEVGKTLPKFSIVQTIAPEFLLNLMKASL
ncbi:membrane bound O-acyl transferase family-domain-containing protein [Ganoderma leucocontextum]|nr:membrane bound O-acyl transferase family-domain-containing protein [Ganoderma leucocontextum]